MPQIASPNWPLPAAVAMVVRYEAAVVPVAAEEIARWRRRAAEIPDPVLRRVALTTIGSESANAEAAAAFATLAPRAHRRTAIELLVAWQLMYDYLDTLGEQPAADPRDGLRLHEALAVALGGPDPARDFYGHHPHRDDGGYLRALATTCRKRLAALPSAAAVAPAALVAAERCAQAQSHVHAALRSGGYDPARAWALERSGADDYAWWEILAGGVSDLAVLALLGTAADPAATHADADAVAGAYWPHVCVLSTLLDGVVDAAADVENAGRSYLVDCCGGPVPAARVARAARRSVAATTGLKRGGTHTAITAGVAAFYSTVPGSRNAHVAATIAPALDALRPAVTPLVTALRARRVWRTVVS